MKQSSTFGSVEAFSCSPVPCPALAGCRVLQVSCGSRHTLAVVAGGQAYSWGWGACGQVRMSWREFFYFNLRNNTDGTRCLSII